MPFGLTEFCHWLPSGYAGSGLQEEEFPLAIGARHPLGLRHNVRATDARDIFTPSLPYMSAQAYPSWIPVTASGPLEQHVLYLPLLGESNLTCGSYKHEPLCVG